MVKPRHWDHKKPTPKETHRSTVAQMPRFYKPDGTPTNDPDEVFKMDRQVARTVLADGKLVSTVFLGVDHGMGLSKKPILWETMVFSNEALGEELYCQRYSSAAAAYGGHAKIVEEWSPESLDWETGELHLPKGDPTNGEAG